MELTKIQIVLLILLMLNVGLLVGDLINSDIVGELFIRLRTSDSAEIDEIISDCDRDSLHSSMQCLNHYIVKNFEYEVTTFTRTPSDTLKYPSDCKSWSSLICFISNRLDYDCELVTFPTGENSAHQIAIISSEGEYCSGDMTSMECYILGNYEED